MPADVVKRLMEFHSSVSKSEDQQAFIDGLNREEVNVIFQSLWNMTYLCYLFQIIKVIPDIFMSNAPSGLIQVLLDGLTNSSRNRDGLLLRVMEVVLDELSEGDIPQQKAVEVVEVLGFKCCQLNADELAKLVQHCLLFLQNGRELKGKYVNKWKDTPDPSSFNGFLLQVVVTIPFTNVRTLQTIKSYGGCWNYQWLSLLWPDHQFPL